MNVSIFIVLNRYVEESSSGVEEDQSSCCSEDTSCTILSDFPDDFSETAEDGQEIGK